MERGKTNKVRGKFKMNSPFRQDVTTSNVTSDTENVTGNTVTTETPDWEGYNKWKAMGGDNIVDKTDATPPPKDEEKGIDRWIDKPIMEVLGLAKKQREARKAKKAERVEEAKTAVGSGTETLKQAKLVERNRKKADRKAKSDIKKAKRDKKKLVEYRKKNPVRGKEAISLVTGGGNKSLV